MRGLSDDVGARAAAAFEDREGQEVDWLYARIYCADGDDTDALLPAIARWFDEVRARWPIRSAHFLRFIDLRGHHVRLPPGGRACARSSASSPTR